MCLHRLFLCTSMCILFVLVCLYVCVSRRVVGKIACLCVLFCVEVGDNECVFTPISSVCVCVVWAGADYTWPGLQLKAHSLLATVQ